jgi:hypothetical protein
VRYWLSCSGCFGCRGYDGGGGDGLVNRDCGFHGCGEWDAKSLCLKSSGYSHVVCR